LTHAGETSEPGALDPFSLVTALATATACLIGGDLIHRRLGV